MSNKYDLIFLDGWKKATAMALILGLVDDYFTQVVRFNSLPNGWESRCIDGTLYLRPPEEVRVLIEQGYTANKLINNDDTNQYDRIIQVGKMTKVGFWR